MRPFRPKTGGEFLPVSNFPTSICRFSPEQGAKPRCSKIPGEAVVKAFNGVDFRNPLEPKDKDIAKAMENLKKRNSKNE